MKNYNTYPKQINTLLEMINEYKELKTEREKLGDIYEYGENESDFDHDKWFELEDRILYFPDMDIKRNNLVSSKEIIEKFEEWKSFENKNTFFNDRKGMPILTINHEIVYYIKSNSVLEENSVFLGKDLNGNEKLHKINDINQLEFNKYWPDGEKIYSQEELKILEKELKEDFKLRRNIEGLHGFPMVMNSGEIIYYGLPYSDKNFEGNSIHNTDPKIYNYKDVDFEKSKNIWPKNNSISNEFENILSYKELSELEKSFKKNNKVRKNTI